MTQNSEHSRIKIKKGPSFEGPGMQSNCAGEGVTLQFVTGLFLHVLRDVFSSIFPCADEIFHSFR